MLGKSRMDENPSGSSKRKVESMAKLLFQSGWSFCRVGEEEHMAPVSLPHDAMLAEPRRADAPGGTNTGWYV